MSSPSTSTATLAFARRFRIARPRMSTASVSVCGLRATAQVMSVVTGAPFSSDVATTSGCPPSRNCTSCGGISRGAFSAIASRTGGNAGRVQPRAEHGARLVPLGALELRRDRRQRRCRIGRRWPERPSRRERRARGAGEIAARVGPRPESTRECGGGGGVHGQWPGKIQLPRGIASRLGGGEIAGIAGRRGGPEKEGDCLRLYHFRGVVCAKWAARVLAS